MGISLLGLVLVLLLVAAVIQNVYIGGLGGVILVVVLVLFLTGRI
jgi:hypothetical protein